MPELKINLNRATEGNPTELLPKETGTLQNENKQLEFRNTPVTNDPANSIPNERPKRIFQSQHTKRQ